MATQEEKIYYIMGRLEEMTNHMRDKKQAKTLTEIAKLLGKCVIKDVEILNVPQELDKLYAKKD